MAAGGQHARYRGALVVRHLADRRRAPLPPVRQQRGRAGAAGAAGGRPRPPGRPHFDLVRSGPYFSVVLAVSSSRSWVRASRGRSIHHDRCRSDDPCRDSVCAEDAAAGGVALRPLPGPDHSGVHLSASRADPLNNVMAEQRNRPRLGAFPILAQGRSGHRQFLDARIRLEPAALRPTAPRRAAADDLGGSTHPPTTRACGTPIGRRWPASSGSGRSQRSTGLTSSTTANSTSPTSTPRAP